MKSKNNPSQLKFWRVQHLANLELLHAANITYDYPPHMHEEYSVGLMLRGAETTICRGASYHARSGSLILINAEEVHANKSAGTEYRVIKIRPQTLSQIAAEILSDKRGTPYFPDLLVYDNALFRLLLKLHLKLEQNIAPLEQESEFISTIGLLLARQNKHRAALQAPGKEPRHIKVIRDYLRAHYAENVSLAQLTALTNLSPFYLLRVFHKQVGVPPHEYQTQVRIAHARKLIRSGVALTQAALETGFFDQSHLARNFKRIVGRTPGRYSAQHKIVQDAPR